jgi:hypothetical protein
LRSVDVPAHFLEHHCRVVTDDLDEARALTADLFGRHQSRPATRHHLLDAHP